MQSISKLCIVMTFSTFERAVLGEIEFDARVTNQQVAKRLGVRVERVSRCRQRLTESGRIRVRAFIDAMALGYINVKLFFSLRSGASTAHKKLLDALDQEPGVAWIGSYAGDYRYGLAYLCRNPLELNDLLDRVGDRFPDLFSAKTLLIRKSFVSYSRPWESRTTRARRSLGLRYVASPHEFDRLDQRILHQLGSHPFTSFRDLAKKLGETASTVTRRVERLEAENVIVGYYYALDPAELGLEIYRLLLDFSSLTSERRKKVYQFVEQHMQGVYVIESLGVWDFELGFETARSRDMSIIVSDLYAEFGDSLQDVKILTELEELQLDFFPFP